MQLVCTPPTLECLLRMPHHETYEVPDAIGVNSEPNKACGTITHITTAANDTNGHVKGSPVAENMPYMQVAERVQNKAYGGVSGAAVNTDTEEQIGVDEMYDYMN